MNLWVRSQNKKLLIPIKSPIYVDDNKINYKESDSYIITIGEYKTNERAIEVLDEIQEAKLGNFHYRCNSNVKVSSKEDTIIYQMPEN